MGAADGAVAFLPPAEAKTRRHGTEEAHDTENRGSLVAIDLAYINTHFPPFFSLSFPWVTTGESLHPFLSSFPAVKHSRCCSTGQTWML